LLHTPLHLQIFSQQEKRVKSGDLRTKKKLFRKLVNVKKEWYFRFLFVVLQIRARRQD
jgi:hypothetical protein